MSGPGDRPGTKRRKKRHRRAPVPLRDVPSRRRFVGQGLALLGASWATGYGLAGSGARAAETGRLPIRPPTADRSDARFRDACIRCGLCAARCPTEAMTMERFNFIESTE